MTYIIYKILDGYKLLEAVTKKESVRNLWVKKLQNAGFDVIVSHEFNEELISQRFYKGGR